MPLPVLFLGVAALGGATGIKKTTQAVLDNSRARLINQTAVASVDVAKAKVNTNRKITADLLNTVGEEKIEILNGSVTSFLDEFTKIKNVNFTGSEGLSELSKIKIDKASFTELGEMCNFAVSLAGGLIAGTAGGALTAFGAYSAASVFATASTGTAIASLSGAAATNATLAFFGGGSLAAGGLGMTGGMAVLGGIVAAPALLALGFISSSKANKNLDQAYINKAEAAEIASQLYAAADQCHAISRRASVIYNLLVRLDSYFLPLLLKLKNTIAEEGTDYRIYTDDSKKAVASAASLAVTIKTVLDTPLLTDDGMLTEESKQLLSLEKKLLIGQ